LGGLTCSRSAQRAGGRERPRYLNPAPINAISERWIDQYDQARVRALADLKRAMEDTPMHKPSFVYTTSINTTPDQLWQALTEPAFTERYWGTTLESDWQVGSTITWHDSGATFADPEQVVLAADPPRRLAYTWHTFTPEWAEAHGFDEQLRAKLAAERRSKVTSTGGRGVQAHRGARRLRARQHGRRDDQRGLAGAAVRPQEPARDRRNRSDGGRRGGVIRG
jgi:uncharacterized protein YndB with AHSA1/START domain